MVLKNKLYTKGIGDVERILEHVSSEEKKLARKAWLEQHYRKEVNTDKKLVGIIKLTKRRSNAYHS